MDQEREELEQRLEEARRTALDVEEGKTSRYWAHIKAKLQGWLKSEQKHLDILNARLIRTPEDAEERNDTVKRIAMLHQVLGINETIIEENLNMIGGIRVDIPDQFKKRHSFVGNPHETSSNGR